MKIWRRYRVARKVSEAIIENFTIRKIAKKVREAMEGKELHAGDELTINYEVKIKFFENGEEVIK